MPILALLIMVAAAVFAAGALLEGNESVRPEVWGVSADVTTAGIFAAGALTMLAFLIGLWLLKHSLARLRRKRSEVKELKRGRNDDVARLQDEKAQLEAALRRDSQVIHDQSGNAATVPIPATGHVAAARENDVPQDQDRGREVQIVRENRVVGGGATSVTSPKPETGRLESLAGEPNRRVDLTDMQERESRR